MAKFGQHETAGRLFVSGVGGVFAVQGDDSKIIKVFLPAPGIWSEQVLREEIDGFLLRAKTQRGLAASSKHWAGIYEISGVREASRDDYRAAGAYATMDRCQRTVQSLIDGQVHITNHDLRNIVSGIIQGLIDIRKLAGRPHGALKPSNILLTHSSDLAAATVLLTDPAPDGSLSQASADRDRADLAHLIYQLVHRRPYDGSTLGRSKEWDALGPNGEDWRKLCRALLDDHAPEMERDLEQILPTLATWTAQPRKNRLPAIIAASVLIVLIGGGGLAYYLTRPPKLPFNQPKWEELCLSYYAWFEDFSDQMSSEASRNKYSSNPYPAEVARLFNEVGHELDDYSPKKIAKTPSSANELALSPTQDAKTGSGPWYTSRGVDLIERVTSAIAPEHWPLLGQLDQTAKIYQQRGWQRPAAAIRAVIDSAQPPPLVAGTAPLADRVKELRRVSVFTNVDNAVVASRLVGNIEDEWKDILAQLQKLPGGDAQKVPLLQALPRFAQDFPRSQLDPAHPPTLTDVKSLADSFAQIQGVVRKLAEKLKPEGGREIVFSELAKDPAMQLPADGVLAPQSFAISPELFQKYFKINDDPRTTVDWARALADVDFNYVNVITDANSQDKNLPALVSQRDALKKYVADWVSVAPIEKNRDQLVSVVRSAQSQLDKLKSDGAQWVSPYIIDPAVYLAQERARPAGSALAKATPVIYESWKTAHAALLTQAQAESQNLKTYRVYKDYLGKFDALEKTYGQFDALIPTPVAGLSEIAANSAPGGGTADWRRVIATRVATVYREKALQDILARFTFTWGTANNAPTLVPDQAFVSFRRERLAAYETTRKDTLALIGDYTTLIDRLDHLDLQPGEPAAGAKSWRDLYTSWEQSKNPLLADDQIAAALKPINTRVAALLALDNAADYKSLLADTASPAPEIVLTAWRKLGAAPVSQDLPVLDDEDKAQASLNARLDALSKAGTLDSPHLQKLTAEMAAQRPIRWHRWVDTLSSATAIQTALDRIDSFKVTLSPQTDSAMLFNQQFYALRKIVEAAPPPAESELKPIAQKFIDTVKTYPAAIQNADVQDLLARMAKSLTQNPEETSALGAGPKLAGWEQDNSRENIRLFYFPSKAAPKYTLEFVRLQAGGKTIFLCTTEVPLGLFADIVNATGKYAEIDNTGKPSSKAHWFKASEDPWNGPRVWRIVDRKFTPNPQWLFKVPQMGENPYYPTGGVPPAPSADQPMQYLSPWSAMYMARLLGCRLPTSEEWKAAYDKFEADNSAAPRDAWNLRGAAWAAQQDYAKTMNKNGMKFADDGIYLTVDLLFDTTKIAGAAKPWKGADLAKIAPQRISATADAYKGSILWFRKVGAQPGAAAPGSGSGALHDLVGNVAEYAFDGPGANAVIKDNTPAVSAIDAAIAAGPAAKRRDLFVIGGSSLSPPDIPFNVKQELDPGFPQTSIGFCDVGFRLAYTAPIDSIFDVLSEAFKNPRYLPGPRARP